MNTRRARRPLGPFGSAAASLLAVVLSGCSGTPFGDQLARSFSAPEQAPNSPAPTPQAPAAPTAKPAATTTPTTPSAPALPGPEAAKAVRAMPPAPYRITIQLPAADPSAPAEAVTEALRKAGVPFEVEMIERVSGNPTPAPAAAPTPAPAAAPRPAPAPRPR